jgi:hypothetical protein
LLCFALLCFALLWFLCVGLGLDRSPMWLLTMLLLATRVGITSLHS